MTTPLLTFDKARAGEIAIDLPVLAYTRALIQGDSGSGKSWMMRWLLEQTHGRIPHLVFDPEGEFATLREKFPYLLVGAGGEIAAKVDQAATLARRLVTLRASVVFDLSELELPDQREYIATFFRALIELPRELRHPMLVVLDEAQTFAPEGGDVISTGPVADVSRRGRKRGLGLICATQRISSFKKEVAGQLKNLFAGASTLDLDVDRLSKRLGFTTKAQREQLMELTPGQFFVHGPAFAGRGVRLAKTPERLQTSHPKVGELQPSAPPAPKEIQGLVAELQDLEKAAAADLDEKAQLEARIRELEDRLYTAERSAPAIPEGSAVFDLDALEAAEQRARAEAAAEARQEELGRLDRWIGAIAARAEAMRAAVDGALGAFNEALRYEPLPAHEATRPDPATDGRGAADELLAAVRDSPPLIGVPARGPQPRTLGAAAGAFRKTAIAVTAPAERRAAHDVERQLTRAPAIERPEASLVFPLKPGQQKILDRMQELAAAGARGVHVRTIAAMAEQSPTSSTFEAHMKRLKDEGYLVPAGAAGYYELTAKGSVAAAKVATPASLRQLHERWHWLLSAPQQKILKLFTASPRTILGKNEIAAKVGQSPTSSTFEAHLKRLSTDFELLERTAPGQYRAGINLFPPGLR